MKNTKIDWCDSTWNPVTGCLHGCEYCYARRIANRFRPREIYDPEMACQRSLIEKGELTGIGSLRTLDFPWEQAIGFCKDTQGFIAVKKRKCPYPFGFEPTFHRYKLDEPQHWKKPRNVFVVSMGDLFGDWVPDDWIREVFDACARAPWHLYLFLTKNPKRIVNIYEEGWLLKGDNAWFGTTITKRDDWAFKCGFRNTFVSCEPILEPIKSKWQIGKQNWVIIGAETGNRKEKVVPKVKWINEILEICEEFGVPIFMKESLRDLMGDDFRQEFPWRRRKGWGV